MLKWLFGGKKPSGDIIIVSGLPRSGTSMMMRMLEAGGIEIVTDNQRQADEDNPRGYFELERVKKVKEDASFLDDMPGKAVKMISMLLRDLPANKRYKVIFMRRNIAEILRSQKLMLQRNDKDVSADNDSDMETIFNKHLHDIMAWLNTQKNIEVIYVDYNDVMQDPLRNAQMINRFIGDRLDVQGMVTVVDPDLYRNRAVKR